MKVILLSIFSLIVVALVQSGMAATITVELDGSGDYTQIQPALDAAESGDTVRIGPGEFTELIPSYIPGYAWDVEVCAYVHVPNLTIIGAGADHTILGPTTYQGSNQTYSPKCLVWLDGNALNVQGITFRNCYESMHVLDGILFVDDCAFESDGAFGILWRTYNPGGSVRNSTFTSGASSQSGISTGWGCSDVLIENCNLNNSRIKIGGSQNIVIQNCELENGVVGIVVGGSDNVLISNCWIQNMSVFGVSVVSEGHTEIRECEISGDVAAIDSCYHSRVSISQSVLLGGEEGVLFLTNSGMVEVENSHLFRNGDLAVNSYRHPELGLVVHEMTGNYWGTTNPDTVANWIWDQNDDPDNFSIVNYLPMADGPVPTKNTSFGSIKAMFR